jgi:AbrB family looped-hinge helix DNA binding protein
MTNVQFEGASRTIDSLGRITIPKSIRTKHECETGDKYDIHSIEVDGKVYIAIGPVNQEQE